MGKLLPLPLRHMPDLTRQDPARQDLMTLCNHPVTTVRTTSVRGLVTCPECRAALPPIAEFGLLIDVLEVFEAPVAPDRWNGFPVPLVDWQIAVAIAAAVGDSRPTPYLGLRPYDGLQWQIVGTP